MIKFIIRRLVICLPLLFGITVISFFVINLAPGGQMALPGAEMNPSFNPHVRAMMNRQFHFDKPLIVQYGLIMRDAFTGRLVSFKDNRSAVLKVLQRMPATLALSAMAMVITLSCALPLGIYAARHHGRWRDKLISLVSFALISLPTFWVAYMLVLACVRAWRIPALGSETFGVEFANPFLGLVDATWHVFLPAVVLALGGIATDSRYMRASMVEAMNEDYIRTARAKGLSETQVAYRHALRNSLRPIVTFIGYLLPAFLGGSVIVEQIFGYPGMGRLMYEAMLERDMPVIMVELVIGSALVLLGNLLADVLYAVVDPRVRLD
jgi:peptide/nickel transport system permease protein